MIVVNPASPVPTFEQLRSRIVEEITAGELPPGTRLPTVRSLANDLGIAPGTVARAYRELESSGDIETRGRHGSFVSLRAAAVSVQAQRAAAVFAEQARALSIDTDEAIAYVVAALRAVPSTP